MVGTHRSREEVDVDARVSKWVMRAVKVLSVGVPLVLYVERRLAHLETSDMVQEERAKNLASRVDRLDLSSASRLGIAADGGFSDPAVRGLFHNTFRAVAESEHLARREDLDRILQLIRRVIEANGLKE